jgi:hypothetical protein
MVDHHVGFFFLFSFFISVVYFLDIFKHHVGAKARCNWYMYHINIFLLLKNREYITFIENRKHIKTVKLHALAT